MNADVVAGARGRLWRSRWAAVGAAVAVTLGGGGLFAVQAASSPPSSVVTISPVRILDTRTDVGLPGPFVSAQSQKLQVTGPAIPTDATGVLLNVTVVAPTANGFLSVRPGDATGPPSTSSLNFNAGAIVPNSVQVGLPTAGANAGQIDITFDAYGVAGPTTEVLIDAVGYMVAGTGGTGSPGPAGPAGPTGPGADQFGAGTGLGLAGGTGSSANCTYGEVMLYAGTYGNGLPANGQTVSAITYSGLFNAIGYKYGGSGDFFQLPDLRSAAPNGMTYFLCVRGTSVIPG